MTLKFDFFADASTQRPKCHELSFLYVAMCCCVLMHVAVCLMYFFLRCCTLFYVAVPRCTVAVRCCTLFYVAVPCCTVVVQKAQAGRKGLNSA